MGAPSSVSRVSSIHGSGFGSGAGSGSGCGADGEMAGVDGVRGRSRRGEWGARSVRAEKRGGVAADHGHRAGTERGEVVLEVVRVEAEVLEVGTEGVRSG